MKRPENDLVRQAVVDWRRDMPQPTLSSDARNVVQRRALEEKVSVGGFPALFVTTRRMVLAGALPLVLLGILVVVATLPGSPIDTEPTVMANRVGNRVIFTIANGNEGHVVYRSTVAHRFDREAGVRVDDGEFEVPVDEDAPSSADSK